MRRRVLCTVLAVLFIIGVLPTGAIADSEGRSQDTGEYYAQESDPPGGPEETEEQSGDTSDETDDSFCVLEESEDHSHDASCDTQEGEPICPLEESEGDTHSEDCYPQNDELISSPEEDEADDEGTEVNLSITAGEKSKITLQTVGSKEVVQFECTKSGLYSFSFAPDEDSGNWPYPNVQYSFYKDSSLENSSLLYQDQTGTYWLYGQQGYYLEEGTTCYLCLENMGYNPSGSTPDSNEITVNLSVAYASLNFKVTNDGDMAADMVLIMNGCNSYAFTENLDAYSTFSPSQDDQSPFQRGDRVALSLKSGESVDITASVYDVNELSWMLLPKYSSGYSAEMSSDVIGQWDGKPDHETINITVNKTAVTDKGEETTFHSISNLTEMVSGQHYIFAVEDDGKYYALAYDENRYVTPVELKKSDEGSYTLEVSKQDLEHSDFVLTSTSAGTVSANKATDLKFVTNYKDPTGKSIYLKLGNGDIDQTMFSTSNGIIEISGQDNQYQVKHTDVTRVLMFDSSGQKFGFAYNTGSNIIILTDAKVTPEKPPEGEQQFVQVDVSDVYNNGGTPLLFTYKIQDGEEWEYYALTSDGAKIIPAPDNETIITDFDNAWAPMSAKDSVYDFTNHFYYNSFAGFRQGDNYLDPAATNLVSKEAKEVYLRYTPYFSETSKISNDDSSFFG